MASSRCLSKKKVFGYKRRGFNISEGKSTSEDILTIAIIDNIIASRLVVFIGFGKLSTSPPTDANIL